MASIDSEVPVGVGDLIFVSSKGAVSDLINLATWGLPRVGFSHVMLVGDRHGYPVIFESTSFNRPPCLIQGRAVRGVQCHNLEDVIERGSKMYLCSLRSELYREQENRYNGYLRGRIGRDYDFIGAGLSGGILLKYLASWGCKESNHTMFCSELAAEAAVITGIWNQRHYSRWSPNSLYRRMFYGGVYNKARRITGSHLVWRKFL